MDYSHLAVYIFNKYAGQYQDKFMDLDLYHDTFDRFCARIEKADAEILEIGCGPGNITRYVLNKRPGFQLFGIDISENMIDLARVNNPAARFQVMDARKIGALDRQYDAILCGFCLPYLSREEAAQLIRDAARLLRPNGVFYASTMENDYSKSGFKGPSSGGDDKLYQYFHEAGYLTEMLQESGFTAIELERKQYPEQDGSYTTDLVILANAAP